MSNLLPPIISGTRDTAGDDLLSRRAIEGSIEACFRSFAYAPIDPPILERSAPFLDRSGEEIRRRLYAFMDPGGREICLRPELTIPACRLYLRKFGNEARESRLSYVGPAFQFVSPGRGRYRQFRQAGVELIGAAKKEAADAEVFALAIEAMREAGIRNPVAIVGDHEIVHQFVDGLSIAPRWKERLKRLVWNDAGLQDLEAQMLKEQGLKSDKISSELIDVLTSIGSEQSHVVIKELLALADVRQIGGRTVDEIAERLLANIVDRDTYPKISEEVIGGLRGLLEIQGRPEESLVEIARHASALGVTTLDETLEKFARRLELIASYGVPPGELLLHVGLRREVAYYTGFVFEIYADKSHELGRLCGGGRYDGLLEALGARRSIPAVGFAIGVDRVSEAIKEEGAAAAPVAAVPSALVVAAGQVRHEDCIRVSTHLRQLGWSVWTDMSGWRPKHATSYAAKHGIPYIAFVGEAEIEAGQVVLKRLKDSYERTISIADLPRAFALEDAVDARTEKPMGKRNATT